MLFNGIKTKTYLSIGFKFPVWFLKIMATNTFMLFYYFGNYYTNFRNNSSSLITENFVYLPAQIHCYTN